MAKRRWRSQTNSKSIRPSKLLSCSNLDHKLQGTGRSQRFCLTCRPCIANRKSHNSRIATTSEDFHCEQSTPAHLQASGSTKWGDNTCPQTMMGTEATNPFLQWASLPTLWPQLLVMSFMQCPSQWALAGTSVHLVNDIFCCFGGNISERTINATTMYLRHAHT